MLVEHNMVDQVHLLFASRASPDRGSSELGHHEFLLIDSFFEVERDFNFATFPLNGELPSSDVNDSSNMVKSVISEDNIICVCVDHNDSGGYSGGSKLYR